MKKFFENKKILVVIIILALLLICLFIGIVAQNHSDHTNKSENDSLESGLTVLDELDEETEDENTITAPSDWGDEGSEEAPNSEENNAANGQALDKSEGETSEINKEDESDLTEENESNLAEEDESNLDEEANKTGGYGEMF